MSGCLSARRRLVKPQKSRWLTKRRDLDFNLGYQKAHSPLYRKRYDVSLVLQIPLIWAVQLDNSICRLLASGFKISFLLKRNFGRVLCKQYPPESCNTALWCKGSTSDFGSDSVGSNPASAANLTFCVPYRGAIFICKGCG